MKKILSALLILVLLLLSACSGSSSAVEEITHRLIDGSPVWVFDLTYTNDTGKPLSVVALEVITEDQTEQITGQALITEGFTHSAEIAPGETYSIYLTTENLNPYPSYTFVLTLRRPDNTCFSDVVTYRLTDYDETPAQRPAQAPSSAEQSDSAHAFPTGDVIALEPENGTDWHFIFDFLNETGEALTLETMEVTNLMNGESLDSHPLSIPASDLPLPSLTVEPDQSFFLEDWHPVVPDFNGRIYRFCFVTASGKPYIREYIFDLLGSGAPAQPHTPVSDPDAPANALLPVFSNNEYHWQFISSFTNETPETLTFQELHIVSFLNGQLQDDIPLTADQLMHIQTTVEPGQPFVFEDWHPVVDHMDERHYVFIFTDPSGTAVEYPFEFPLSMDTTQQRPPVSVQTMSLPVIDYANDPGRNLIALCYDASFSMEVAPDVFWVSAATLGGSDYANHDIHAMLSLSPEEKQANIDTLYEALQLYEISDFTPSDDNVRISENGINWEHHKPGFHAVATNTGCCATDSNWLNYILRNDYEEVGFIATSQRDGSGHIYNYIYQDGWYYFIDLTAHRRGDNVAIPETGDRSTFDARNFGLNGILRTSSLESYVQFVQDTFMDPPGLMFCYQNEDCLAVDGVRSQSGIAITYGVPKGVSIDVIFDDPSDSLTHAFTDEPTRLPDWEASSRYPFP